MNVLAFWVLLLIIVSVTLTLIAAKGYKFMDFVMHLTMTAVSAVGDKLLMGIWDFIIM